MLRALKDTIGPDLRNVLRDLVVSLAPSDRVKAAAHFYARLEPSPEEVESILLATNVEPSRREALYVEVAMLKEGAVPLRLPRMRMICALSTRLVSSNRLPPDEMTLLRTSLRIAGTEARVGDTRMRELLADPVVRAAKQRI